MLQVAAVDRCPVCKRPGRRLHEEVPDGFGITANPWAFDQCKDARCAHVWLNPAPLEAELAKAYRDYPIHAEPGPVARAGRPSVALRTYTAAKRVLGVERRRRLLDRFLLPSSGGQRVLEVGCGTGTRLEDLRSLGYSVEGQEVAPEAVRLACARGLQVHLGDLAQLGLPAGSYDVVALHHVLEHVHDPVGMLAMCRSLVQPGGRVVSIQPNAASRAHRRFGRHWVGLDPPRHLQGFSPASARRCAEQAGYGRIRVRTTAIRNEDWVRMSLAWTAQGGGRPLPSMRALDVSAAMSQLASLAWQVVEPSGGDEIVLEMA